MVVNILLLLIILGIGGIIGLMIYYLKKIGSGKEVSINVDKYKSISMEKDDNIDRNNRGSGDNRFKEVIEIMRVKLLREEAEERDRELVRLSKLNIRNSMPSEIKMNVSGEENKVRMKNKGILIPIGLSERDKEILREFYD